MPESIAWADADKNRVYMTFNGFMDLDEAKKLRDDLAKALEKVTPGFTMVTDAQNYKPGSKEVQEVIASMAKLDADAGVSRVARVVGSQPLGGMQIDRLAKETADGEYPARHFETKEEAEAWLDSE